MLDFGPTPLNALGSNEPIANSPWSLIATFVTPRIAGNANDASGAGTCQCQARFVRRSQILPLVTNSPASFIATFEPAVALGGCRGHGRRVAASHTRRSPDVVLDTIVLPSGEYFTAEIAPCWPSR